LMYILLGGHYILLQDLQKLAIRCELWHGHVYPIWRSAALETARTNATIRKDSKFALDFASRNINIDAVVTELDQLLLWSSQVGPPRFGSYPKEDFFPFFSHVQTFRAIQEAFINSGLLGCQDLTSCEFKRTQRRRRRLRV